MTQNPAPSFGWALEDKPVQDYDPRLWGGGTWEAALCHPPLQVQQIRDLRQVILDWAKPTPEGWERKVFVRDEDGETENDLEQSFRRLTDASDSANQLNFYLDHPLVLPPGSRHTEAKVWVENEQTLVILKQHAAWTGVLRRDITNFFRYRHLVRGLVGVVCPTALAWGEHAETWPVEQWSPARSLDSFAYLWAAFLEGLEQIDPPVANMPWLEPEFRLMARSEGVIGC